MKEKDREDRVTVEISQTINEKVDDLCKRTGMKKKSLVDQLIKFGFPVAEQNLKSVMQPQR